MILLNAVTEHFDPKHTTQLRALTLPSDALDFEMGLKNAYGKALAIYGVECDKQVYERSTQRAQDLELSINLSHCYDYNFLADTKMLFNFAWLDWMGGWDSKKEAVLANLTSQRTTFAEGNPLIAITIQDARECEGSDALIEEILDEDFVCNDRDLMRTLRFKARLGAIPKKINREAHLNRRSLVPLAFYRYRDGYRSNRTAPMIMALYEVVPKISKVDIWATEVIELNSGSAREMKAPGTKELAA
jgi:hypothetical protein